MLDFGFLSNALHFPLLSDIPTRIPWTVRMLFSLHANFETSAVVIRACNSWTVQNLWNLNIHTTFRGFLNSSKFSNCMYHGCCLGPCFKTITKMRNCCRHLSLLGRLYICINLDTLCLNSCQIVSTEIYFHTLIWKLRYWCLTWSPFKSRV
jgi:hypothetical protein